MYVYILCSLRGFYFHFVFRPDFYPPQYFSRALSRRHRHIYRAARTEHQKECAYVPAVPLSPPTMLETQYWPPIEQCVKYETS